METDDLLKVLCTGTKDGKNVRTVRSVTPVEITVSEDGNSAVVTAAVKMVFQEEMDLGRTRFSKPKTLTVEWSWVRYSDIWKIRL